MKIDKSKSFQDRIKFLEKCAQLYETNGFSPISDKDYDEEYYELEKMNPDHEFFKTVGGINEEFIYGQTFKHEYIMGSLSKCLDIGQVKDWVSSKFKDGSDDFILQHKIDGLSLSLIYKDKKLFKAVTRGDGEVGIDVTANAKYIDGVLKVIDYDGEIEIRGECYKDRQDFYKNWHTSVGGEYKNPRNFSAGSINQKDPLVTKERGLSFVAYEVVRKDFETEVEKNKFIASLGFNHLWHKDISKYIPKNCGLEKIVKGVDVYMSLIDRQSLPYDIDGVVIKLNNIKKAKSMGSTAGGRKPQSSRAVKFPPEEKETVLEGVLCNVGRTGVLTPVASLRPVELGGAMISQATLHNYGALVGKDALKIGATVIIAKKGDIIPQIISVKNNGDKDIEFPTHCPSCGEPVSWDTNKVNLVCNNTLCPAQLTSRIDHWFKKIGVKGIGKGIISKLVDLEWENEKVVSCIADMYYKLDNDRECEHPFRKYKFLQEEFGEKTYQNILKSIKSVNKIPLNLFIEALGISKVGRMAKDITNIAPTIEDIDRLNSEDIKKLDGFSDIKAEGFVNGWNLIREEIEVLSRHIEIEKFELSSDKLSGEKYCFTGSFNIPRKELEKMVVDNGGKCGSVSKTLNALVWDGETTKGKYEKAKKMGISIISEEDFLKKLN